MRKTAFAVVVFLLAGFVQAQQLKVAAAADLTYAMRALAAQYQQKTGNQVLLSFGASGSFYAQMKNGAPYDLFFSADAQYPQKLVAEGRMEKGSLTTYGLGHLVLWVPTRSGLNVRELKMDALLQPSVKKIAIANPEHAPYGRAAIAALEHFQLKGLVNDKLVLGENVSQAAEFAVSGSAQAALIAKSLALAPAMKGAGQYWDIPLDSYPEIEQVAGISTSTKLKTAAQDFMNFVRSAEGANILQQYGFGLPAHQ